MSYLRKIEYELVLNDSFWIIRNCPKCGRKTHYKNTKKFRINANGYRLDIWLIYQCVECKHTLNLAICERKKVSSMTKDEYQCFLDNDEQLAETYGKNMQLFQSNKAVIDFDRLRFSLVKLHETRENSGFGEQLIITVKNPYQMKIRSEKQIAMVLGLSRNQVKSLLDKGEIELVMELPQSVSFSISHCLFSMVT